MKRILITCISLLWLVSCGSNANRQAAATPVARPDTAGWPASFGFGHDATPQQIAALDISIRPDGKGLPGGSGDVATGRALYAAKCASCHGANGTGGAYAPLVGAMGDTGKAKTIGNYWPYATTLFDYIRRAMPYNAPGSLSNNEVYALTAYLLQANKIIDAQAIINAQTLPEIVMPARKLFVNDDRRGGPEVR